MKNYILRIFKILAISIGALYIIFCVALYFFQEKLIFHPVKLASDYTFDFERDFEEVKMLTADNVKLHALWFKSKNPQGAVLFFHGNGGCVRGWGLNAGKFIDSQYDVFIMDYRGYGKSGGIIPTEAQFYQDAQLAYDELKKKYAENNIVVLGHSLGSAPATKIAADNHPQRLILKAPLYSLKDVVKNNPNAMLTKLIPTFLLKYDFPNYKYLAECEAPVTIFHGDNDRVIYNGSSVKLKKYFKPSDTLITLSGVGHNTISRDPVYREQLKELLAMDSK